MSKIYTIALAATLALSAVADDGRGPFRFPKRGFPQGTVNLKPLFDYWHAVQPNGQGVRPLAGWKIIVGQVVENRGSGWIVDVRVFASPGSNQTRRIYLLHPPIAEKAMFDNLVSTRNAAERNVAYYNGVAGGYQSSASAYDRAAKTSANIRNNLPNSISGTADANAHFSNARAVQQGMNENAAWEASKQAMLQAADATKQLENIHDNSLPSAPPNTYQMEWFALETGKAMYDLPVFDCGFYRPTDQTH